MTRGTFAVLLATALALPSAARAFCGTYVSAPGITLANRTSHVVLAYEGDTTTLTLSSDVQGQAVDFGLLIPVPDVLEESDVSVLPDPAVIDELEAFTDPRLVAYAGCEELFPYWYDGAWHDEPDGSYRGACAGSVGGGVGCANEYALSKDAAGDWTTHVDVEAVFRDGSYEFALLSADDAASLNAWLDAQGFAAVPEAEPILDEYLDQGVGFLAARVVLEDAPDADGTELSPIQIRYPYRSLDLPLRLGAANGAGEQEVLLHVLADEADGAFQVTSFPEVAVEDECMLRDEDFAAVWASTLVEAFGSVEAGWLLEYSWPTATKCDPCPNGMFWDHERMSVAFGRDTYEGHLTRIRLRYDPAAVDTDLHLSTTGSDAQEQIRYIVYNEALAGDLPVCGEGIVGDGTCADRDPPPVRGSLGGDCGGPFGVLPWLVLAGAAFRRRP